MLCVCLQAAHQFSGNMSLTHPTRVERLANKTTRREINNCGYILITMLLKLSLQVNTEQGTVIRK